MRLRQLKPQIDAGETIIDKNADGYTAVYKDMSTKRVYISYEEGKHKRHNGFDALCKHIAYEEDETDRDGEMLLSNEDCKWEIEPPLTADEQVVQNEFERIYKEGGADAAVKALYRMVADKQIKEYERKVFQIKNKKRRQQVVGMIQFMRTWHKQLVEEVTA